MGVAAALQLDLIYHNELKTFTINTLVKSKKRHPFLSYYSTETSALAPK